MTQLNRIAKLILDTPLLVYPETALTIVSVFADRFGIDPIDLPNAATPAPRRDTGSSEGLYQVEDGVATIPIVGELVNRGGWIGASSGLVSYKGLEKQLSAAASDPDVKGILLDIDSPGGEVMGTMETAALIREIAGQKPVVAYVDGLAASAGYALASGASYIVATPSSLLGSIGVVMVHIDRTEEMAKAGLKPTIIQAGAFKTDFSSLKALPDDARQRMQARINETYDLFVQTVASHRGMAQKAVRGTEAGVFMGRAAVQQGLADAVGGMRDALAYLKQSRANQYAIGANMTDLPVQAIAKSDHEKALAETERAALDLGRQEATKRISAILDAPEAKGRDKLARHLAFSTNMAVDDAIGLLAAAPEGQAEPPRPQPRLSGIVPNPDISPDPLAQGDGSGETPWAAIVDGINRHEAEAHRAAGGVFVIPAPVRI